MTGAPASDTLRLPAEGPGSSAPFGPRAGAFVVDVIASALVAGLFVAIFGSGHGTGRLPQQWSLIPLAVDYLVGLCLFGRTLGMNLFGLRVARTDGKARIDPIRAVIRLVLLSILVPAVIWDRNRRGLHDRFTDTVVVRM